MSRVSGTVAMPTSSVSVASGSATIDGNRVYFNNAQNMIINGVFSSSYDNYVVFISHWVATGELTFPRLTAGGVRQNGPNDYTVQRCDLGGTVLNASRGTTSATTLYSDSNQSGTGVLYFFNPAKSDYKAMKFLVGNGDGGQTSSYVATTTAFTTVCDGFSIDNSVGISGHLEVHAFNQ